MKADLITINTLSQNRDIYIDTNAFRSEHSVYLLVPFARKVFPEAKIVPLILRQKVDFPYYYNLGKEVSKMVNLDETVLVISSDFSHSVSREAAKLNDQKSMELLKRMNIADINSVENDCKQCTDFLYGYLEGKDISFELIFNKNSFDISGESSESVTSYVGAYFIKK